MRLQLLQIVTAETPSAQRCSPHGPQRRPKLENGQVYCHRCSGFGRTPSDLDSRGCGVCDGSGVLKRERFGVVNAIKQNLEGNESVQFVNGVNAEGRAHLALRRSYAEDYSERGQISIYTAPYTDYGRKTAVPIYARDANAEEPVQCRMPVALPDGDAPSEIMVMPGGTHFITPSMAGKAVEITVQVGPDSAAAMQAALKAHLASGPQKPWFDFNHDGGPASAWPLEFVWRESPAPGVYARVEWSQAGRDAVAGKMYRAFSPVFFVDSPKAKPARVTGAPLNMGTLVNEPAFKKISPIWASQSGINHRGTEGAEEEEMTEQELAALRARLAQLETENSELKASQASSAHTAAIAAKDEEIAQLKQSLAKVDGEIKARNKAAATAAVLAAVKRGALPPKDEAVQARWTALIEADPANEVLLAAMPGNPALTPVTAANAGGRANDAIQASVTITREDSQRVLRAYADARTPDERAAIYASDISPRLRKREDFPLVVKASDAVQAANTSGTYASDIISQRALETLVQEFPFLGQISSDFSNETVSVKYNQTFRTRLVAIPSVTSYDPDNGYTSSNTTVTDVPVVIDQHKAVQIEFNEHELGSTGRDLFQEQVVGMNYALGETFMTALLGVITVAHFPKATNETVVSLANWDRKGVIKLARKLTGRKVPKVRRQLLLNGEYHDKLGEDTVIVSAFNNMDAGDTIATGELPVVHKFAIHDALVLPIGENLTGFACFPSALAIAARLPDDYTKILPGATGGAVTRIIKDAATGLSLLIVDFLDHKLAKAYKRAAFMYGVAKGDPAAGERLCSAATP